MRFPLAVGFAASVAMSVVGGSHPASAASTSTDWTQEGFNGQHTGDNPAETILTRSNVGHLTSAFSTRVNPNNPQIAGVYPDPIVAGGVVYLSNSGNGIVEAIDGASGAVKWRVTPHCYGETTAPAFAGGQIWIGNDDPAISAISTGGVQISCLPLFYAVGYGLSPPSAGNGRVYAEADDGGVGAVNATTGAILWSTNSNVGDASTPTVSADGRAVFVGGYGSQTQQLLYKLNATTGAVMWSRDLGACGEVDHSLGFDGFPEQLQYSLRTFGGNGQHRLAGKWSGRCGGCWRSCIQWFSRVQRHQWKSGLEQSHILRKLPRRGQRRRLRRRVE